MRILALTDIHGLYKRAEEIIMRESADVVIIGGDLTAVGTVKEADEAIQRFKLHCSVIFCVAGNMDLPQHDELFQRIGVSINKRGKCYNNIGFFGASAAPFSPLHTPYEISEEEMLERIKIGYENVKQCPVKIFIPHAPPYGTKVDIVHTGIHVGSLSVRDFIEEKEPEVVICGHIHEARGKDKIGSTTIINCGPASNGYYGVVEIEKDIKVSNCQLKI